jgi:glucose 1-dehydrogenase
MPHPKRLQDKVAIVTGSSSGIGQAIAIRLASEGANIVVDFRSHPDGAEETKSKIESAGGKAIVVHADVSKIADTQNLVDQAYAQLHRCDILINNAGVEKNAPFCDVTEADYDQVLNINLKGAFFLTQAFVKKLQAAHLPGRVLNISSVHEDMVFPNFSSYCAKLNALLANIPLGRLGTPEDVAALAAFLASDEAAYITGSTYAVDGGLLRNYHEQ